jgi:hypothetical protein
VGLTTPHSKKLIVTKVEQRKKLDRFKVDGESWWQIGKNGRILLDRPKPTAGCSANGRRRRRSILFRHSSTKETAVVIAMRLV